MGQTHRANVYLGIDTVTGKKVTTKLPTYTKKELKAKVKQVQFDFVANSSTCFKEVVVETYEQLAMLWCDSYKHTVKSNTRITHKII